jgi:hypothetical protein
LPIENHHKKTSTVKQNSEPLLWSEKNLLSALDFHVNIFKDCQEIENNFDRML